MISNSGHDERGQYSGGAAGDQTGGEWSRISWYSRPWNIVLRYPDPAVRGLIAQLAGEAADNNKIGYDQSERGMFWIRLKQAGFFPSAIRILCEADCSSGVAAVVKAVGNILGIEKLKAVSSDMYTGNERTLLMSAGFKALTDSKYLTSDQHLLPGDILLYEKHHTAINLDYGSKTVRGDMKPQDIISACAAFYKVERAGGYTYGDSHGIPPCSDHVTSCDRGSVARPLWDLGFHDQPAGGITVLNMEQYLTKWGFKKITDQNAVAAGDIVLMKQNGTTAPTAAWHTFLVTAVTRSGSVMTVNKYDFGSQERLRAAQPFVGVPLNQWPGTKTFYCIFRWEEKETDYTFAPKDLKLKSSSTSAYLATEILKARGYQGVKDSKGVMQDLQLNFVWTKGDMAAMARYKWDRTISGKNLSVGPYGAGEIGPSDWVDLLGGKIPFTAVELPAKQTRGTSVLLCQEILRARGIKGKDGKALALDSEWGDNTAFAVRKYQKARGLTQTGKVDYDTWKDMIGAM